MSVPRPDQERHPTESEAVVHLPKFTVLSTDGDLLTKVISFVDGKLHKVACAQPGLATAETHRVGSLDEFSAILDSLAPTQATMYGVMIGAESATVVTEARRNRVPGAIARTRQFFQFAPAPGVMMFDHDGTVDGTPISVEELHRRLVAAVPCIASVRVLARPSASSGLVAPDGKPVPGGTGLRFYVLVDDASLIPDAGEAIWNLLWAAGEGWIVVGKAGQKLQRSLFDKSVWQPERLDFSAAPIVREPLRRDPPRARLIGGDEPRLDLRKVIALADGSVRRRADKIRSAALQAADRESADVRRTWVHDEAPKLAARQHVTLEQATEALSHASSSCTLLGNFELHTEDGSTVTVAELLAEPDRWHGTRFCDPLEPDYRGDKRIAMANLKSGGPPYIYSHAHGGCRYRLARQLRSIVVREGERPRIVDECLDALRAAGEVFELGSTHALVRIVGGSVEPVSSPWLLDYLQRIARFEKERVVHNVVQRFPSDLKKEIAEAVLAKGGERRLPCLTAVVTAATLRSDGSLLDETGHDHSSGLLLLREDCDGPARIPTDPSPAEALAALRELWHPFRLFPFVTPVDRGTYLAALLTACVRASLPTAPGFAIDAPTPGTGKTLLASCIGALATGAPPAILPPIQAQHEDEVRKRLFAMLRGGARVLVLDNVRERLGSPSLDAFLTAPTFSDRVLGVSETQALPNRALLLVTGNNLHIDGDTCRRILRVRLDAKEERPYARAFEFCPLQWTVANRQQMVACGLTILRARIAAGRPRPAKGRVASFEEWDDLVRQAVVWIASVAEDAGDPELRSYADPVSGIDASFSVDTETAKLKAFLPAWFGLLGDRRCVLSEAFAEVEKQRSSTHATNLIDVVIEITEDRGPGERRKIGRWMEHNVDRPIDGLCLRRGSPRGGRATWWVERSGPPSSTHPGRS